MPEPASTPTLEIHLADLERSLRHPRRAFSYIMSVLIGAATIAVMFPLFSVLYKLVKRGAGSLSWRPSPSCRRPR